MAEEAGTAYQAMQDATMAVREAEVALSYAKGSQERGNAARALQTAKADLDRAKRAFSASRRKMAQSFR